MAFNITRKFNEYKRVLKVTKKPSMAEFKAIVKVTAIGTLIIGAIGFVINLAATLIKAM